MRLTLLLLGLRHAATLNANVNYCSTKLPIGLPDDRMLTEPESICERPLSRTQEELTSHTFELRQQPVTSLGGVTVQSASSPDVMT